MGRFQKLEDESLVITRDVFNLWLDDPEMHVLLEELDISTGSKKQLFDVLDCDLSGELEVGEIISGLMRLRGPTEKCDVVAALLSVRHMVPMLQEVLDRLTDGAATGLVKL